MTREERLLGVTREQLRNAGIEVGVSAGERKAGTIVGAARSGLVDVVITDEGTALEALRLTGPLHVAEAQPTRRAPSTATTVNTSGAR